MKPGIAICMTALMLCAPIALADKYYKWQDENGTWHYSKQAPKDANAEPLKVRSRGATPTDEELAAQAAAEREAKTKALTDGSDSANCKRARENLNILLNNTQVQKDKDGDGKEEILTEDEQLAEVSATRKQVEKFCGN